MNVSVIVPTYNGARKIVNVLRALEHQEVQPDEVIVVIDGSTDNTESVLKQHQFNLKNFRIHKQKNGGRAKVRNTGASLASGELLIFFDDDMRPDFQCVKVHIEHHQMFPESILTGSAMEEVLQTASDILRFKAYLSKKWNSAYVHDTLNPLSEEQVFITAANFSIRKNTLQKLGGFDERLTDAEDYDLAVRAFRRQVPLFVNLNAHAWHDDKITCASYIKRLRQYNKAQEKLRVLEPKLYTNNKFLTSPPKGLKRSIFLFFAKKFWIQLVDQNSILKIIPKKLRYKIYDFIITANGVLFPDKIKL